MVETISLFPGVTLRCYRDTRFKQGALSLQFVRPMCREESALNALLPSVLLRGTSGHPDLRSITVHLDDLYGASVSTLVRRIGDYQTTGLYCGFMEDRFALDGDRILAPMIDFLEELLLDPILENGIFHREFVESEKKNLISTIESELNDKRAYAAGKLLKAMCQADSYGIPRLGEKEQVAAITPDCLYTHYQKILSQSPVEIFYVGSTEMSTVAELLKPLFLRMDRNYVNLPAQTPFHSCPGSHLTEEMEISQGKLCMGFVTPITNQSPQFAAMQMANAIFGAGMTSKLFMNIREKLSLCYAIGSGYYGSKGILTVSAGIDSCQEEEVRAQILRQLAACAQGDISPDELSAAREAMLSGLRTVHDSPGAIEGYYSTAALNGLAMTPAEYMAAIESVTAEAVAKAAATVQLHSSFFLKGGRPMIQHYPKLGEQLFWEKLPCGLTVAVVSRPNFTRKLAYFVTDYGSIHTDFTLEGQDYSAPAGVAHFLEHKMFDLPGRDISSEFASLGGNVNAFTSYDMTAYYVSCSENFEENLRLLLEFVSTPYFTEESVHKEMGIIDQEIGMNIDAPDSRIFENLMGAMYQNHPIRVPILGSSESIRRISAQTLYDCHRAFYTPANMILCVVGDVAPDTVTRIATEVLGTDYQEPGEKKRHWPEEIGVCRDLTQMTMDVAMPTFQLGFKCESIGSGDASIRQEIIGDLAAEALFGESSTLYLKLYEEGLIDSSFGGGLETIDGCCLLTCGGDSEDPEAVRDAILRQAAVLDKEGIPEADFLRMKRSAMGRRIRDLDSFDSTAFRVCAYHFSDFDYFRFPEIYAQVTCAEIQQFIGRVVCKDRCSLSIITAR